MADAQPFQWTFDPSPAAAAGTGFDTFSVGVYQWRPKASGRGLKKSTTIRVCGYTAEPQRVYDRATELCRQLNAANVDAAGLPPWVQKQYAVPRPAGRPVERRSDRLTPSQVRSVRLRVARDHLLPVEFVVGTNATYVRRRGDQIHLVGFQGSKYGDEFTVNLGFHYAFVPPPGTEQPTPLAAWREVDCGFRARIGGFVGDGRDLWFKYGIDRAALAGVMTRCVADALAVFDRIGVEWADPTVALATAEPAWDSTMPAVRAFIHLRVGDWPAAAVDLADYLDDDRFLPDEPPLADAIRDLLDRRSTEWPDWVLP